MNGKCHLAYLDTRKGHSFQVVFLSMADDADAQFVGALEGLGLVDNDGLARFDDEAPGAAGGEVLNGLGPDAGNVETHILLGLGSLDQGPAGLLLH